jgi:hypothetical protein
MTFATRRRDADRHTALSVSRDLDQREFERMLGRLVRVGQSAPWWIGDAIVYSGRRSGERYRDAAKATGKSVGTLKNYAWTARRVPVENREPALPFRSHVFVAALPPDD